MAGSNVEPRCLLFHVLAELIEIQLLRLVQTENARMRTHTQGGTSVRQKTGK